MKIKLIGIFTATILWSNNPVSGAEADNLIIYHKSFLSGAGTSGAMTKNLVNGNTEKVSSITSYAGLIGFSRLIINNFYLNLEYSLSMDMLLDTVTVTQTDSYIRVDEASDFKLRSSNTLSGKIIETNNRFFIGFTYLTKLDSIFNLNYRLFYSYIIAQQYTENRVSNTPVSVLGNTVYDHKTDVDSYKKSKGFHGVSGEIELEILLGNYFSVPLQVRYNHIFIPNHFEENDRIFDEVHQEVWFGTGINFRI